MSKLFILTAIAVQLFTVTASAKCLVRTHQDFISLEHSDILVEKGYTVDQITGPIPSGYREAMFMYENFILQEGEYTIYAGSIRLKKGFMLYKKENGYLQLVATDSAYTQSTATIMESSIPSCKRP